MASVHEEGTIGPGAVANGNRIPEEFAETVFGEVTKQLQGADTCCHELWHGEMHRETGEGSRRDQIKAMGGKTPEAFVQMCNWYGPMDFAYFQKKGTFYDYHTDLWGSSHFRFLEFLDTDGKSSPMVRFANTLVQANVRETLSGSCSGC